LCLLVAGVFSAPAAALDERSSQSLAHYIVASLYERRGELDSAVTEYKEALKADFENSAIHLSLAASYIKKNDLTAAVDELSLAIKFNPESVEPHAILALLYAAQNKNNLATQEYEFAVKNASKLEPKNINIYKTLGVLYLEQDKLSDALNTYNLILGLAPEDAEARFYLANVYERLKNREAAVKELKKSLELKPDYAEALNYLGYMYVEDGKNLDSAEELIRRALKSQPDNGAYVDSLGWFYFKKGKLSLALKELERASALLEDPVIYDHLGDAYFKTGEVEKAKTSWGKSLSLDPKQESVKKKLEGFKK